MIETATLYYRRDSGYYVAECLLCGNVSPMLSTGDAQHAAERHAEWYCARQAPVSLRV